MKTIQFIVASAIAAGSISAQADVRNMSGFYAGGNFGYSAGTGKTSANSVNVTNTSYSQNGDTATHGLRGGLHFGYGQVMQNKLYLGLEASADLSNNKGKSDTISNVGGGAAAQRNTLFSMKRRDSFGLALRGGAMLNSVLMYGKVGVDTAKWKFNASQTFNTGAGAVQNNAKSQRLAGLVLGLGAETMITDHITTGFEWAHTRYRKASNIVLTNPTGTPGQIDFKAKPRTNDFRVRLSYKW